jgi:hypothetical protein
LVSCKKNLQTSTIELVFLAPKCNVKNYLWFGGSIDMAERWERFSGVSSYHQRDLDLTLDLSDKGLNLPGKEMIAI